MFYYSQVATTPTSTNTNENRFVKPNSQSPLVSNCYPNMCSSPYLGNQFTSNYNDSVYSSGYSSANSSFNNQSMFQNSPFMTITNQTYNFINQTTVSEDYKFKYSIFYFFIVNKYF